MSLACVPKVLAQSKKGVPGTVRLYVSFAHQDTEVTQAAECFHTPSATCWGRGGRGDLTARLHVNPEKESLVRSQAHPQVFSKTLAQSFASGITVSLFYLFQLAIYFQATSGVK